MIKKVLAFICVLALVVSMCSVFSFAAEPDVKAPHEGTRTGGVHYVVKVATYMYVNETCTGAYACPSLLSPGAHLVKIGGNSTSYKMMYGSYVGYILASRLTEVQ